MQKYVNWPAMKITPGVQADVRSAMHATGMSRKELADELGLHPSWVTRFFNGTIKNLNEEMVERLEKILKFKFGKISTRGVSKEGLEVAVAFDRHEPFAKTVSVLMETMVNSPQVPTYIAQRDLPHIGRAIIELSMENYQQPQRAAEEVIALLSRKPRPGDNG